MTLLVQDMKGHDNLLISVSNLYTNSKITQMHVTGLYPKQRKLSIVEREIFYCTRGF